MRTNKEIVECYEKYADTVYRVAYLYMKNMQDAEDMMQSVFEKYIDSDTVFADENHLKAWLITVTKNICKNSLNSVWKSRRDDWEQVLDDYTLTHTDTYQMEGITFNEIKKLKKHYQGALAIESSEADYINNKEKITTVPNDPEPVSELLSEQATKPLEEPVSDPLSEQVTKPLEEMPSEIDIIDNNDYYTLSLEVVSSDNGLISVGDKYCTIYGRSGSLHETTDKTDTAYDDFVFNYDYIIYVPLDQIYDINNNPVGKGILETTENMPSLSITVYYDGMVLESYPAQIYADKVIINNMICD